MIKQSLWFGGGQTQDFPVLHAAAVPLDLVGRVAELQQVLDVVGRLAAPHAITEHDCSLGVREVPKTFLLLGTKFFFHDFADRDRVSTLCGVKLGPWNILGSRDGTLGNPVRCA